MTEVFKSASKIVFILLTVAVIVGVFAGKVDAKDMILLAGMAYTYYFKNNQPSGSTQ